jgi:hypothetical protein
VLAGTKVLACSVQWDVISTVCAATLGECAVGLADSVGVAASWVGVAR